MTAQDVEAKRERAYELLGNQWLNGAPFTLDEAGGKVLLLLFWDSSCVHGSRVLALVRRWRERYAECGLLTAGVHEPRFPFGREAARVAAALGPEEQGFPVVMDNDGIIAARYGVRNVPALVLVDGGGYIRFRAEHEGNEGQAERALQVLLLEAGWCDDLPLPIVRTGGHTFAPRGTPDLLAGYIRGSLGNAEGYSPESVVAYPDPAIYFEGRFYAAGEWLNGRTHLALVGDTGEVVVTYQGAEAHAVLGQEGGEACEITVRQDDGYLTEHNRGADVRILPDGRSIVVVGEPRSYHLVRNQVHGRHTLRLTAPQTGLQLYGIGFVPGAVPDPVMNN